MGNAWPVGPVMVTGATGTVGRSVVEQLLTAGRPVRTGVRNPATADLPPGVEVVRLDFTDRATVAPALAGAEGLFLMRPPAISDVGTALGPLVESAGAAGVSRVVALSVMGVNPAMPHWRMERMVRKAGLDLTALRPAYFAQNFVTAFGADIRRRSQLRLACGNGRLSFVDTRDVAAVAARVLAEPGRFDPGPVTLTGPEALSFEDVASVLSDALGRRVVYVAQSLRKRRRELRAEGLDPALVRVQLVIDATTRLGLAKKVTDDLPRILERPAGTLAQFVADYRAAWIT